MDKRIPIVYIFFYKRLKERSRTNHINKSKIYEIFGKSNLRKSGFPHILIKYIIQDFVYYNLLERVNVKTYRIVNNDCDKYLNKLFLYTNG